ncbi:hypothetical protein F5883DRAFT_244967 [Diaporthe sp. PMI_573]|nr:hypothetical protein F5883DRAFT_244967 [Diaporthaceae sp. PMI_573]
MSQCLNLTHCYSTAFSTLYLFLALYRGCSSRPLHRCSSRPLRRRSSRPFVAVRNPSSLFVAIRRGSFVAVHCGLRCRPHHACWLLPAPLRHVQCCPKPDFAAGTLMPSPRVGVTSQGPGHGQLPLWSRAGELSDRYSRYYSFTLFAILPIM